MSRLTFGTPPSPETRLCRHGDPQCPCQDGDMCHYEGADPMTPPRQQAAPIVAIRPSGPHGSELLIVQDGRQTIVPLSWGHLSSLAADAVAAMIRYEEPR